MSSSVPSQSSINAASTNLTASYLHHIQKGKLIQPFGCLLAIDENNLNVVAFSENAPDMLTMAGDRPALGIGTDVRTIFTDPSASALQKALGFGDVSLVNPTLVHCKSSGKPFYAIVHRAAGSLIVDLEPVEPCEAPMNAPGALQSYKLAAKAIARLQSLPGGGVERLCDAMAREVFELTGYDRVMVHKFHEDDHGEVVAEVAKPGLEPYLGLHYPAADIPQASRSSFLNNSVRMIADRNAKHVKVFGDEKLPLDLTLSGSTMRAPHSCHLQYMASMNCVASLVVAVVVNEGDDEERDNAESAEPQKRKRLWGLVVCHSTAPRLVPFPIRYACEFLARAFASHVNNKESELENRAVEKKKNILRSQTLLCDMLMRDAPLGVVLADFSPKPINFAPSGGQIVAASLT